MYNWDCKFKPDMSPEIKPDKVKCKKAKVVSETLPTCDADFVCPTPLRAHFIKVPVVLTEEKIQIDVESKVKFEEPALEIKRIKKNVYIKQCKVIVTDPPHGCKPAKGKLYIGGYVRKNIEYATPGCKGRYVQNGDIKHLTVKVPFRCVADIKFELADPVLSYPYKQLQFEVLGESCECDCLDTLTGKKECEDISITKEDFMEPIFCELESAKILEIDLHEEMEGDDDGWEKHKKDYFTGMVEKMAIYVKVKILQKQQICGFDGLCRTAPADQRDLDEY